MKTDITTAVIAALVGVIIAYMITANVILGAPKPVSIRNLSSTVSSNIDEPNPEVFNYRALNPTVEVYVDCTHYDVSGSCLDGGGE